MEMLPHRPPFLLIDKIMELSDKWLLNPSIFFALKGDNFDGNLYAQSAIEKGASYASSSFV